LGGRDLVKVTHRFMFKRAYSPATLNVGRVK
jgi:hypothetical protein